jgi:hypothetical protein
VSWDLVLVPPEHADDPAEWLEARVVEGTTADPTAAKEHADVILERRPELAASEPDAEGIIEVGLREEGGFPLTILLDGAHAELAVPYWDLGEQGAVGARMVVDVVTALSAHTGWVAFDPQQDEVIGLDDLHEGFTGGHARGVGMTKDVGDELAD